MRTIEKRPSGPSRRRTCGVAAATFLLALLVAMPAQAVRVCTYNILNFPGSTGTARVPYFRTVVEEVDPDVLVVQEMLSLSGVNQFLGDVMNYSTPGLYAAGPFVNGPDTDNALFYKPSVVELVSHSEISTALRNISEYVLRPVGHTSIEAEFRVYSLHLKAGSSSSDQSKRLGEATILRDHLNDLAGGSWFISAGDYNIRASSETAYQKLTGSEADNDGRLKDPINSPGNWHDNASFAWIHTQSPRTTQFGGGAHGGMDDRFDILLISYGLDDGQGMDFIPGTRVALGNDGLHFNMAINEGTNYAVTEEVADAIHEAADHLPLYADFQLPALMDAPSSLAFGSAVVGADASVPLILENVAAAPADELSYSLSFPAGFTGPSGPFELTAGDAASHDISLDTSSAGEATGTLTLSTDDPDHPSWPVGLSGTVLDHAVPSLAENQVTAAGSLDFGSHPSGEFQEEEVWVWNYGYCSTQALLEVYDAEFVGGDGRFSLAGGAIPAEVGASPADYFVEFDDTGAAADSLYTAVLTFSTRDDQDVIGASTLCDLVVDLSAYVQSGTDVPGGQARELSLSLLSANPFRRQAELALALPTSGQARVDIYDVRGRLVATPLSAALPSGEHRIVWDGKDETGDRAPSGIYFVRAAVGEWDESRKILLLR
ncbi:MAG: choice-of-anchor D domain-containing protein [Candidatus Eisenbacteria bacterium]|nr:choice-of-anchor D domain-containing protein [Candidatus Eisenbacteria bacterium]